MSSECFSAFHDYSYTLFVSMVENVHAISFAHPISHYTSANTQNWGVEPFDELTRDIHNYEKRRGDLPVQKVRMPCQQLILGCDLVSVVIAVCNCKAFMYVVVCPYMHTSTCA